MTEGYLSGHDEFFSVAHDPKVEAGQRKPTFRDISPTALMELGEVMRLGREKYGAYNWAEYPMKASTYYDAILRHLFAWWNGASIDEESHLSHMAHIMACAQILFEQEKLSQLEDDRPHFLLYNYDDEVEYIQTAQRARS